MDRIEKLVAIIAAAAMVAIVLLVALGPPGPPAIPTASERALPDVARGAAAQQARARSPATADETDDLGEAAGAEPCPECSEPGAAHDPDCGLSVRDARAAGGGATGPLGPGARLAAGEIARGPIRPAASGPGAAARPDRRETSKPAGPRTDEAKEMPRPVGRFDIWINGSVWHAVLTLGAEGEPSFMNYGYFHHGYSREDVKDVVWNADARTLTFAREFTPRIWQNYRLVFNTDLSFEGTHDGDAQCKGGPRREADFSPMPQGVYNLVCAENGSRAHLRISGNDPAKLDGTVNYGLFHDGYEEERLKDVKWDATNHTLTFFRPGSNQWTWLTFRENGSAFYGTFTVSPGTFWSLTGTRL